MFYIVILYCLYLSDETCRAAELPFEHVLAGFSSSRHRLKTGACSLHGTKVETDPAYGRIEGPVKLFAAFDTEAELLRFDRVEPVRLNESLERATLPQDGWITGTLTGKYVKSSSRVLYWLDHTPKKGRTGGVGIYPASTPAPVQVSPFDLRSVGAMWYHSYLTNLQLDTLLIALNKQAVSGKAVVLGNGITRLSFRVKTTETRIDFDETRQFVPLRCETYLCNKDGTAGNRPDFTTTTEWIQISGLWVPAALKLWYEAGPGSSTSYDLTFDWQKVNEPLPAELFQPRGMDLHDTLTIFQTTGTERSVPLGKIGDLTPHWPLAADEPVPSDPRPWVRRPIGLAAVGLALVAAAVLGLIGWRRLRHPKPATGP